jgi:uncharacterized phage protein (TIGR01671 family)
VSRVIKFRAWDKRNEEMCEVININFKMNLIGVICIDRSTVYMDSSQPMTDRLYAIERVELMQYTGLNDKNGKEIYEGDIIKYNEGKTLSRAKMVVKWQQGSLSYSLLAFKEDWAYELGECISDTLEVIGNIYENPDLLGGV